MKEIETGKDKIQKICDILRKETLEPVKQEAREIVENATMQAQEILQKAKEEVEREAHVAKEEWVKRKKIFEAALKFAGHQAIEEVKQKIEKRFFHENLQQLLQEKMTSVDLVTEMIRVIIEAIKKEGIECDLTVAIAKKIPLAQINALLGSQILEKLKDKKLHYGDFEGGIRVHLEQLHMTIDLSDEAVRDLMVEYLRDDFRKLIFQ